MFIEILPAFLEGSTWANMFALDHEKVTWIEKILRPILVYAALIFFLRLFGKRELAQLNPFDLVILLTLSNTVQNAIIGDDTSLSGGIVGAASLLGINYAMADLKYRSKKAEMIIEGGSRILIEDGKIKPEAVARELMTEDDLEVIAHKQGIETVGDIKKCIIDANGNFLVIGKKDDKDEEYKKEILDKINNLTAQLSNLQNSLQKS
jgi:uncharacterized membrane protein YcaP (DUF421 family)